MKLLQPGTTDSSELRIAYSRLKAYYYNNECIHLQALVRSTFIRFIQQLRDMKSKDADANKKPMLYIVTKNPEPSTLDEAV